jgi:tetratricopeptide (TPR) repeat protein
MEIIPTIIPETERFAETGTTGAETLKALCDQVIGLDVAYDDVAEQIEDLAYDEYGRGGAGEAVAQLGRVAGFFERMRNKNEEIASGLAQVYLLIGQIYQYAGLFGDSIEWLNKSAVVDDMHPVVYHCLALSYQGIGDDDLAIKAFEQEIKVAPGNYYTYLLLADLYEKHGRLGAQEDVLKRLLERAPENIQGLHILIRLYERTSPDLDVSLLRRRLLNRAGSLNRLEAAIRTYHLCATGRPQEAVDFLEAYSKTSPSTPIIHLVYAHIYGIMRQYSKKRQELALFKEKNQGKKDAMEINLVEFSSIFGESAAEVLRQRLKAVPSASM